MTFELFFYVALGVAKVLAIIILYQCWQDWRKPTLWLGRSTSERGRTRLELRTDNGEGSHVVLMSPAGYTDKKKLTEVEQKIRHSKVLLSVERKEG